MPEDLYGPLRCMNPYCPTLCELPLDGRPGAFCSAVCKSRYSRRRAELARDLRDLEVAIGAAPKKDRPELRRRRKALRFHLMRHPVIDTTLS
ncbi:hypothetical protein [Cellulomonas xiejunii]|uniref:DUF2116 family Zn-ribbon domain-containing protein n=1 Tax=Cellulomonas xiejunii TaxID=2968083 RepID=A0ABY5KQ38_9CELL|nr:hypothetical protein [Cellulomonas xiejunii]MCC2321271.1 hypothetical protein [Cellulomonas xiejunii]UUI71859.1 hypothetical protein NP048_19065 [Cellulomonas xiejunii]